MSSSVNSSSETLIRLLEKSKEFGSEYGNALANHLPMALIALERIGANSRHISDFYLHYSPILEEPDSGKIDINTSTWSLHMGEHRYSLPYRNFFIEEISNKGVEKALKAYLPTLLKGVSGGAFHPLIRLAYGIEVDSDWEIAESLASWCLAYNELGPLSQSQAAPISPLEALKILSDQTQEAPIPVSGERVSEWLKSVATNQIFVDFYAGLNSKQLTIHDLADTTILLYLSTKDSFTALHCVTATHALRVVSEYYYDQTAVQYLWQSICASFVVSKCLAIAPNHAFGELPDWEKIFEATWTNRNDHVIKFVYSAHCEFQHYRNPLYQFAAAKKSGLIK
ncbi:MAG: questin oxidase family protein [Pseudobdellovibrionaceae bacterium]